MSVISVPQFRITTDDLPDADKKFKRAIEPLLEALNRTLGSAVKDLVQGDSATPLVTSFNAAANGAAYLQIGVGQPIKEIWVSWLEPKAGQLATVWSMSPTATSSGALLLFQGLAPNAAYTVKLRYL
jgi:hypothetical protein